MDADRVAAWLDDMVARSAASMEVELGGETACRIHKDGRVTGGLKYHEGRLAAFAEARRIVRRGSASSEDVRAYHERWRAELDRRIDTAPPSPPWIAYATGGAEAADEVAAVLVPDDTP